MNGVLETSGVLLEQKADGTLVIGCVRYVAATARSRDVEYRYAFDGKNAQKLKATLLGFDCGSLAEMLESKFGEVFDMNAFENLCHDCGIEFVKSDRIMLY